MTPRLSFGLTGGVPPGRLTANGFGTPSEESRRYAFGLAGELSLSSKLSVTVNPLYKRTGSSTGNGFPVFFYDPGPDSVFQYASNLPTRFRAHSLELPVIGKYHFGRESARWRPFLGAGFALQTAWQTVESQYLVRNKETAALIFNNVRTERRTSTDTGVVGSAGFTFRKGALVFVPELRYKRWGSISPARDRQQADALLTIRFGR